MISPSRPGWKPLAATPVANVNHELKTPVAAMGVLAEALLESTDDPETVQRFGQKLTESRRLADMVGELIELSRLQGAERLPDLVSVDVDSVVQEAISRDIRWRLTTLISLSARMRRVACRCWVTRVAGDRVANLISNAIAYSRTRRRCRSAAAVAATRWRSLSPTGASASRWPIRNAFSNVFPGRQGARGPPAAPAGARDRQTRGRQPQRHHSPVEPARNRLDIHPVHPGLRRNGRCGDRRTGGSVIRVLIVEDEGRWLIRWRTCCRRRFETTVVADGPSALAEFDRTGADIVLLDPMLPGMSGTDVCKQLRARSSVPVIMVTARDSEIDKGCSDWNSEPTTTSPSPIRRAN